MIETNFNEKRIESEKSDELPEIMPVLPLRDNVIFPYMIFPVLVGREPSIKAASAAYNSDKYIFLAAQKKASLEEPEKEDIFEDGVIAKIIQYLTLPNGLVKILVDAALKGKIIQYTDKQDYFEAKIKSIVPKLIKTPETNALIRQMDALVKEYIKSNKMLPSEVMNAYENIAEPDRRLFFAAANINQKIEIKQRILQKDKFEDQVYELVKILSSEIDILKIEKEIESKVRENIEKSQRQYVIQEQIRVLQNELGESGETGSESAKIKEKILNAKMPEHAEKKALEELERFKKTPQISPEATIIGSYIDWLCEVPWHFKTQDNLDIKRVHKILNTDHYGLEKPKERILEHIAVLNLVQNLRGQILCFVGPPGVGKTSLGKSIARALGRKFVRISLGGVRDEAEIRGHRRTYIGAMPGKIIQSMKKAGSINPVMLLDEIDKMSMDFRGDPSSAMLEVLDPEQNHTFNDHYLDVDYDLSQVLFITTANVKYNIPLPLLDRMEIIELPGYLDYEKKHIAFNHIIPKQIEAHGLKNNQIKFKPEAVDKIIMEYTKEAGVRNLEREIASICRKTTKRIVSSQALKNSKKSMIIDPNIIEEFLGVPKYKNHKKPNGVRIGSAVGLAWTSVGGEILQVDATIMPGAEKLTLTGQMGNIMKESAQAALSFVKSNCDKLGVDRNFFKDKELHIHLPEGAIPKDGPSAGITMAIAIISLATGKPTNVNTAMTGEITLRGEVLPIGGLTEKLLAAQRNDIKTVLIPKGNKADLLEIKKEVKKGLKIVLVETLFDAIDYSLIKTKKIV